MKRRRDVLDWLAYRVGNRKLAKRLISHKGFREFCERRMDSYELTLELPPLTPSQAEWVRNVADAWLLDDRDGVKPLGWVRILERRLFATRESSKATALAGSELGRPPRGAQFILMLIPRKNREHLIGCMEEEYRTIILPEYGKFWSRIWYWEQTVLALGFYLWPLIKRVVGLEVIWKVIGK